MRETKVPQAMKDWKTNWTSIPDLKVRKMDAWMPHLPHPLVVPQADKDWEKAHWPPLPHLVRENGLILVHLPLPLVPQADKDWEKAHWPPLPHVVWDNGLILVHLPHPLVPQAMKDWKTNWASIPDLKVRKMEAWMPHLPQPLLSQAVKDWEEAHWPPLPHLVGKNGLILVQLPPGNQRALRLH